jgi:hypothetical protein
MEHLQGWVCENPECGAVYAEYTNGCPKCWHERNELVCGVRHQRITFEAAEGRWNE